MPEITPSKYTVFASWDDVPHLSERAKRELYESTPEHLRKARSEGIPTQGSGAVFPILIDTILEDPIEIPDYWPRIVGIDFGWDHPTAASWLAYDRDADCIHVYADYRQAREPPVVHAAAIRSRGDWIPVAWPHDAYQHDKGSGTSLRDIYLAQGVNMLGSNAAYPDSSISVEKGVMDMLDRMRTGRWKVARTCRAWIEEFGLYHRENGRIIKEFDDTISASRYAMMMLRFAVSYYEAVNQYDDDAQVDSFCAPQGRSTIGGY